MTEWWSSNHPMYQSAQVLKISQMDPSVRNDILARDGSCMAPALDFDAGPCYDRWGERMPVYGQKWEDLEVDYVRLDALGPRHVLAEDHVALCPGHHRGTGPNKGRQWGPGHRRVMREYLSSRNQQW